MAWWNQKGGGDPQPTPKPMDGETRLIQKPKTSMEEFKNDWVANMRRRIQGGGGSSGEGFKKGGKVKQTGKAKVHKGEYVIKKAAADKLGPKKLASLNQANRDKKILQKTRFR